MKWALNLMACQYLYVREEKEFIYKITQTQNRRQCNDRGRDLEQDSDKPRNNYWKKPEECTKEPNIKTSEVGSKIL